MEQNSKAREVFLYVVFGVLTTLINIITYTFFVKLNMDYKIATTIAFVVSIIFAFFTNRKYVFIRKDEKQSQIFNEFIKFVTGRLLTYFLDLIGLIMLIQFLHFDEIISKCIISIIVIICNYVISKYWAFR